MKNTVSHLPENHEEAGPSLQGSKSVASASEGVSDAFPSWLPYALICVVVLLGHGLALNADFYMDDFPHILEDETVQGKVWDPLYAFRSIPYVIYRQIYAVAGPSSFAFHALNFLLHLATTLVVFATGKLFFRRLKLLDTEEARMKAALVGSLVFAAHPLGTEAVNYARCSMIQLVTFFSMLAAYHALRWTENRKAGSVAAALFFMLLATYSKDPGMFHAGMNLAIIGLLFFEKRWITEVRAWSEGRGKRQAITACFVATAGVLWLAPKWTEIVYAKITQSGQSYVDHWFTQGRAVWGYLAQMVAPVNLTSDHLLAWSRSPVKDAPAGLGLLLVVILGIAIIAGLFRAKSRVWCALAALILAPLALRFGFPVFEHFVEYRAYPCLPWLGVLAGLGFGLLFARRPKPALWAAFALVTAGVTVSALRSAVWSDGAALARHALEQYPLNNRPRTQLQAAAYRKGNYEEVLKIGTEIRAVYQAQAEFNAVNPHGRQLDPNRAIYDLVNCEQLTTYAVAELFDSKEALKFANERIGHYRSHLGLEKEMEIRKALGTLLKARHVLEVHGEEYDRKKAQAKTASPVDRVVVD